jgi:competence protein ComEA
MFKRLLAAVLAFLAMSVFAAVDVNKATPADLDGVKGIGPAIAGRIVEERNKTPFKDWQDFIDRVKGVGEGNAAKFSAAGLTVGGASFKGAAPAPKKEDKAAVKPAAAAAAATPPAATPAAAAAPTKAELKAQKAKEAADAKAAKAEAKAKAKAEKEAAAQAKKDKVKAAAAAASATKK